VRAPRLGARPVFVKIPFTALRSVTVGPHHRVMFVQSESTPSRRRRFFGRDVPQPAPLPEPEGYEAQSQMLTELFHAGRLDRPGYEFARRQLQLAYGIGLLPEARGREA